MLWPCLAAAEDEPIIYTVKKGDTLWDISQRFIKDPYYWPNLWSNNPAIGNPHLIYPGQRLRIYDGRIEIIPVDEEAATDVGAAVVTPEEILLIPTYGGAQSFISNGQLDTLGSIADTVDNRVLIATGDKVFLEMNDLASVSPGDRYDLINVGKEVIHPVSKLPIGFQTTLLGTLEVSKVTPSVAVATITNATREIERGARILPHTEIPDRLPRLLAETPAEGYILSDDIGKMAMGQWEGALIDLGEESGLQPGVELDIYRKRQATEQADSSRPLLLPDIDLGDAIVLSVRPGFAEVLITRTTNLPIYRGDQVRTKLKQ
jgi:LysM repeat protein